MMIKVLK